MGLKDLQLKSEYRTLVDDVPKDFYIPVLKLATKYQRAVGFFSSSALVAISAGLNGLIENGGNIQLIASPKLSLEDIQAIKKGYAAREVIESALAREINENDEEHREQLSYISLLIATGKLDIKIVTLQKNNDISMYHEKLGIISDNEGNSIAFSGSMNESENAFVSNYESFDVFCSWTADAERVFNKQMAFNAIWNDYEPGIKVTPFPEAVRQKLLQAYSYNEVHGNRPSDNKDVNTEKVNVRPAIYLPDGFSIRPYQKEAIETWATNNYIGLFNMATGTGKTLTALAGVEKLFRDLDNRLAVIIVCPYQHLVTQWSEDIIQFGMSPILGFSGSTQKDWKKHLEQAVRSFELGSSNHFCFVTTVDSFKTPSVYKHISKLTTDVVLVVDEAHNMGATDNRNYLPDNIQYRIGLSATIERHQDEIGTQLLRSYFGTECISYPLERAIQEDMLTPYRYHPIIVTLDEDELDEYLKLTAMIMQYTKMKNGKVQISDVGKRLLIKRSRIVAGARQKIPALRKAIEPYSEDKHILVYCGATKVDYPEEEGDYQSELDQIRVVAELLGNELNMRVGRFTSKEDAKERSKIRELFADGTQLQALVAIKCLDEGVNIPSIKTAFILASSTNPKEYIQRRGRVLRKYPGKTYAEIYDFITLPFDPNSTGSIRPEMISASKGLAKRELVRMMDFAAIADNPSESNDIIFDLKHVFQITDDELMKAGGNEDVI